MGASAGAARRAPHQCNQAPQRPLKSTHFRATLGAVAAVFALTNVVLQMKIKRSRSRRTDVCDCSLRRGNEGQLCGGHLAVRIPLQNPNRLPPRSSSSAHLGLASLQRYLPAWQTRSACTSPSRPCLRPCVHGRDPSAFLLPLQLVDFALTTSPESPTAPQYELKYEEVEDCNPISVVIRGEHAGGVAAGAIAHSGCRRST